MGKPISMKSRCALIYFKGRVPGELKHLSTRRKRKQLSFSKITADLSAVALVKVDSVSSGERKRISLNFRNRAFNSAFGLKRKQKDPCPYVFRVLQDIYVCCMDPARQRDKV